MKRRVSLLAAAALALLLNGEAQSDEQSSDAARPAGLIGRLAEPGLQALSKADYDSAVARFESALQSEPDSADLHFLAGLSYHFMARTESSSYRPLAETALRVALRIDPSHALAYRELGWVLLDDKRYQEAEAAFAGAAYYGGQDPSMSGLSVSAYYSADYPLAAWASRQLSDASPATWQMRALVDSLGGDANKAGDDLNRFKQSGVAAPRVAALENAMNQWRDIRADTVNLIVPKPTPAAYVYTPPGYGPAPPRTAAQNLPPPAPGPTPPGGAASPGAQPIARDWSDCLQRPETGASSGAYAGPGVAYAPPAANASAGVPFADETTSLPPLPSPCEGRPLPRMALIDAVIIRTIINGSSAHGVNLLDQLAVVLGGQLLSSHVHANGGPTPGSVTTLTSDLSLSLPGNGIQYSLNIANAAGVRSEVLSRPSLLALDRQPSVFFSGSTLTVALPGQLSGGSLGQIPVGTSFSVTPTFVDNDVLLLSVKAARSFFENSSGGSFGQSVQTSRNSVTANVMVRMGQTVVLSGLSERETQVLSSEVPVLGQIPGLQYLLNRSSDEDFRTSIIILLTPRPAQPDPQSAAPDLDQLSDADKARLDGFRARVASEFKPIPNLEAVKYHLRTNRMYKIISGGTIEDDMWEGSSERFQLDNELKGLLHF